MSKFPCGLPSWIVNYKLKYLEPIPIPEELEDFFFFVYLRLDLDNVKHNFNLYGLSAKQLEKLSILHNEQRIKYLSTLDHWRNNRRVSAHFEHLENEMAKLLPKVKFSQCGFEKDPNFQIRFRDYAFLSLPKFIANQFLFGKEPVKPPDSVEEYFCFYERNWNSERKSFTFDENPQKWRETWQYCSSRKHFDRVPNNFLSMKENFDVCHETWQRTLSIEEKQNFRNFKTLRSEIVKELY
jgi:hypothetical protein